MLLSSVHTYITCVTPNTRIKNSFKHFYLNLTSSYIISKVTVWFYICRKSFLTGGIKSLDQASLHLNKHIKYRQSATLFFI